jgi:hypothetical protein
MGFSHSWIAVKGVTTERALEALGMEISRVQTDYLEGIALIEWPDDWLLVLSDNSEEAIDGDLTRLAPLGRAVVCSIEEHVMQSEARGYEDGVQVWSVLHDPNGDESIYSLRIAGSPPEQLDDIVRAVKAEQDAEGGEDAGADVMFDIPPKLAASICGFMLGEEDPAAVRHSSLKLIGSAEPAERTERPGFFARLFGRA